MISPVGSALSDKLVVGSYKYEPSIFTVTVAPSLLIESKLETLRSSSSGSVSFDSTP